MSGRAELRFGTRRRIRLVFLDRVEILLVVLAEICELLGDRLSRLASVDFVVHGVEKLALDALVVVGSTCFLSGLVAVELGLQGLVLLGLFRVRRIRFRRVLQRLGHSFGLQGLGRLLGYEADVDGLSVQAEDLTGLLFGRQVFVVQDVPQSGPRKDSRHLRSFLAR